MRLLLTCIIFTLLLSCQSSEPKKSSEKPTLKKTLNEVWVEFDPSLKPGVKPSLAMTDVFELPEGGLEVTLDRPFRISEIEFVFEQGDRYRLELRSGDTVHTSYHARSPMLTAIDDLYPAHFLMDDTSASRYTTNIRVVPDSGNGFYRAGHLVIVSND